VCVRACARARVCVCVSIYFRVRQANEEVEKLIKQFNATVRQQSAKYNKSTGHFSTGSRIERRSRCVNALGDKLLEVIEVNVPFNVSCIFW